MSATVAQSFGETSVMDIVLQQNVGMGRCSKPWWANILAIWIVCKTILCVILGFVRRQNCEPCQFQYTYCFFLIYDIFRETIYIYYIVGSIWISFGGFSMWFFCPMAQWPLPLCRAATGFHSQIRWSRHWDLSGWPTGWSIDVPTEWVVTCSPAPTNIKKNHGLHNPHKPLNQSSTNKSSFHGSSGPWELFTDSHWNSELWISWALVVTNKKRLLRPPKTPA